MKNISWQNLYIRKTISPMAALLSSFLLFALPVSADARLDAEPLWLTKELRVPESVLFYQNNKESYLLVSEIDGDGSALDGKGGIAKLSVKGEIIDQDWVTGLNAPKGMAVHDGMLFVADVNEVVFINMKSQKVVTKVKVADAVFLNDVAVDDRGVIYVSDTRTNKIHRIVDKKAELYLENISSANGLKIIGSNLMIGAGQVLWIADRDKNLFKVAEGFESGIDGIEMVKPGEFIISCWVGLLYYVYADGRIEKLLDSRETKINTADIGYDENKSIVYVPNFLKNSVTAYQLR